MIQPKIIKCPYCCNSFQPGEVDFRLERPLDGGGDPHSNPAGTPFGGVTSKRQIRNKGYVLDKKLYNYYKYYLQYSEEDAISNAIQLPAINMDPLSSDIIMNVEDWNRFGYVNSIQYKGQELDKRLCPYCHNLVIPSAGKYDMLMISMIGDTNVGKSVFLTVLQQVLKEDNFEGNLAFMGTDEERETYFGSIDRLLNKRKVLDATNRVRVPPMPFLYTYRVADSNEKQYKLIVFCDIAGEDCRSESTMRQHGFHLKASDGFLFLIDVTRFPKVKYTIDEGATIENYYQNEVFVAINRFMIANSYENTTSVPTAIVLTKCDVLDQVGALHGKEEYQSLIKRQDFRELNPGYIQFEEMNMLNEVVPNMMNELGEKALIRAVEDNFSSYNYFVASALGKSPELVERSENGRTIKENKIKGQINPYRVSEPFHWLLAENDAIPYKYYEVLRNKKNEERRIEFYYYESERGHLMQKIEAARRAAGISRLNSWINGNWMVVEQSSH